MGDIKWLNVKIKFLDLYHNLELFVKKEIIFLLDNPLVYFINIYL